MAISGGHENIVGTRHDTEGVVRAAAVGGSITEVLGGVTALVLAILGLLNIYPAILLPVATIAAGVAILFEGGALAARFYRALDYFRRESTEDFVGGGMALEWLGGIAGIVLGILALVGLAPMVLVPCAAIVYGVSMIIACAASTRVNTLFYSSWGETPESGRLVSEAVSAASGSEFVAGLSTGVLGILALVGFNPPVLCLCAMLVIGASTLLNGSAIAGKMATYFSK